MIYTDFYDSSQDKIIRYPVAGGGSGGVSSFNGREGSVLPVAGDYDDTQVVLSSTMHIGGQTQTNVKGAIDALDTKKIETIRVATEQEWNQMSETEKNDPNKIYLLPWRRSESTTGVKSFNGRSGSVLPTAGDYSAQDITYGQATVKDALDNIGNSVVASFNGRNGSVLPVSGDYDDAKVVLSSTMSIGGQIKTNVKDALSALNNSKIETIKVDTEAEWDLIPTADKNDPNKIYLLPWKEGGSVGSGMNASRINAIISAATNASDFAAFKAAMALI